MILRGKFIDLLRTYFSLKRIFPFISIHDMDMNNKEAYLK